MKISKVIKYIVSLAVAAVFLYFSFRGIDWKKFADGFSNCAHIFIFLAMLSSVLAAFLRSLRWRILMRPFDPQMRVLTAFDGVNIGYLANFVFPRIGEIVRCGFVSRSSRNSHRGGADRGISFEQAVGTVLLSRSWDVIVVFLLVAVLLAVHRAQFGHFFAESILAPFENRLEISGWWLALAILALVAGALCLVWRLRGRVRLFNRICSFCKGIIQGFIAFAHMDGKLLFLAYTAGMWAMYWLMSMSVIWAMPQMEALGIADAWFLCLAGSIAWMVPVPGGFGAYHYIVALAVSSVYGMGWEDGMLYATLNHEAQAIVMVVCGMVSYLVEIFMVKGFNRK